MKRYHITFKNGLQNPVDLDANDIEDAKNRALAHHRLNSGFVEHVDLLHTVDTVVESVTEIV